MNDFTIVRPKLMATHPIRRLWLTALTFIVSDAAALLLAATVTVLARWYFNGHYNLFDYFRFAPVLALFLVAFAVVGLYPGIALSPVDEMRKVLSAVSVGHLAILAVTYLFRGSDTYSRAIFLITWVLMTLFVVVSRNTVRAVFCEQPWWGVPVAILGSGDVGQLVLRTLQKRPSIGLKAAAILDPSMELDSPDHNAEDACFVGGLAWAPILARDYRLSYAIVAMPELPFKQLTSLLSRYAQDFRHLLVIPDLVGMTTIGVCTRDVGGLVGIEMSHKLVHHFPQLGKRALDLAVAGFCGISLFPLFLIVCLCVRLSGPGPILYGQRRVGRGNRPFTAWKFRSMVSNADQVLNDYLDRNPDLARQWQTDRKLRNDPRVTRVGKILRKTSLDEIPQLWNILCGEMSLVGPRPIVEGEIPKYGEAFDLYTRVRPGVTGLWQVSGRNNTTYKERIEFDEFYVKNWSVWLDFYILGRTVRAVLIADGAY